MGQIRPPDPVLLFVGILYSDDKVFHNAYELLEKHFGEILFAGISIPWNYSQYYQKEIGYPLLRRFLFFKTLIYPDNLADIKLQTNEIENIFSFNDKRRINLDPGYLTLSKIVLASTKNYAHRIYLGKGIYGEVTLIYRNGTYKPHIFSYKDYQDEFYIKTFMNIRLLYKEMLL